MELDREIKRGKAEKGRSKVRSQGERERGPGECVSEREKEREKPRL